jgi:hypothetical protein
VPFKVKVRRGRRHPDDPQPDGVGKEETEEQSGEEMSSGDSNDERAFAIQPHAVESPPESDRGRSPSRKRSEIDQKIASLLGNLPRSDSSDETDMNEQEYEEFIRKRRAERMRKTQFDRKRTVSERQFTDDESEGDPQRGQLVWELDTESSDSEPKPEKGEQEEDGLRHAQKKRQMEWFLKRGERPQRVERVEDQEEDEEDRKRPEHLEHVKSASPRQDGEEIEQGEKQRAKEHDREELNSEQKGNEMGGPPEHRTEASEAYLRFLREEKNKYPRGKSNSALDLADLELRGDDLELWRRERDEGEAGDGIESLEEPGNLHQEIGEGYVGSSNPPANNGPPTPPLQPRVRQWYWNHEDKDYVRYNRGMWIIIEYPC